MPPALRRLSSLLRLRDLLRRPRRLPRRQVRGASDVHPSRPQRILLLPSAAVAVWKRSPLGRDYRRLWLANAVSVTGDGVTVTAGPLLAASITRDPLLVAGALFAQLLPWLIFALLSGVLVDRQEPARLIVIVDLLRAAALVGLAVSVLAGDGASGRALRCAVHRWHRFYRFRYGGAEPAATAGGSG